MSLRRCRKEWKRSDPRWKWLFIVSIWQTSASNNSLWVCCWQWCDSSAIFASLSFSSAPWETKMLSIAKVFIQNTVSVLCQLHWSCAMLVQWGFGGFSLYCTPASTYVLTYLLWGVGYIHIHHLYNLGLCMRAFRVNLYHVLCHHKSGVLRPLWDKPSLPDFVCKEMKIKKG